jgi:segregation and condensation protein B
MEIPDLTQHIEALLFSLARPLSRKELAAMLDASEEDIERALQTLQEARIRGAIVLVDDGVEVELRTGAHSAALIEKVRKEEYTREIGKAGLEALAAVLYRGPLTRSEIDFIRGVNSSQTLRTLTLRGLLRKVEGGGGKRASFTYEPSTELLAELGITRPQELPDYTEVRSKLDSLEEKYQQPTNAEQTPTS